jgi:hypothetical protein
MADTPRRVADYSRVALALIRLFNGAAALFVPRFLARRLGVDPDSNPAVIYSLRLFGIRTIVIGAELLLPDGEVRRHSVRVAPLIHGSDAVTAWLTVVERQLPARSAKTAAIISTVNTILAFLAQRRS